MLGRNRVFHLTRENDVTLFSQNLTLFGFTVMEVIFTFEISLASREQGEPIFLR